MRNNMKRENQLSLIFLFLLSLIRRSFPFPQAPKIGICGSSRLCLISDDDACLDEDMLADKKLSNDDINDDIAIQENVGNELPGLSPVCRIVTRAGSAIKPSFVRQRRPFLLDKLDAYYHAQARKLIQEGLPGTSSNSKLTIEEQPILEIIGKAQIDDSINESEPDLSILRQSLEESGFNLVNKRDIDLCKSLNAGYLLRLSIREIVKDLEKISHDFYPERYSNNNSAHSIKTEEIEELLFDGRALVFWRGYSQEVTSGQLLIPKIDYLQASVVQRGAARLKSKIDRLESKIVRSITLRIRLLRQYIQTALMTVREKRVQRWMERIKSVKRKVNNQVNITGIDSMKGKEKNKSIRGIIKLDRYGGSKIRSRSSDPTNPLDPFIICDNYYDGNNIQPGGMIKNTTNYETSADLYNNNAYICAYDERKRENGKGLSKMQFLDRVSISNLVDVFTTMGRRGLLQTLFAQSELVEPTYEEVVVIWRPLLKKKKRMMGPPKIVSELADMLDIKGYEQPKKEEFKSKKEKLEIRLFQQVPMSNLQAVLPKTKLVFRPADAVLFDTISFATLAIVVGSIKFDSYKLDLLALVSITLWILRTVFRYSNKLARYDLLVKTFLTSKISQRDSGAFQYLVYEAGSQRAIRAALVHQCILSVFNERMNSQYPKESESETSSIEISLSELSREIDNQVDLLLDTETVVKLDVTKVIKDLKDLQLVSVSERDNLVTMVKDVDSSTETIKRLWAELLDDSTRSSVYSHFRDINSTIVAEIE